MSYFVEDIDEYGVEMPGQRLSDSVNFEVDLLNPSQIKSGNLHKKVGRIGGENSLRVGLANPI